jgi:predicted nucleic acid-binding Zn ribbon protein
MTYDYICTKCGKKIEVEETLKEHQEGTPPKCCEIEAKRIYVVSDLWTETGSGRVH